LARRAKKETGIAVHNDLLYNAALSGILMAATAGATPVGGSYATLVSAAEAVALQIDTAIANDATISQAGGTPILGANTTAAQAASQFGKTNMMTNLCFAVFQGKNVQGASPAVDITNIVALYTAGIAGLATT
jgi:hypothetical protein